MYAYGADADLTSRPRAQVGWKEHARTSRLLRTAGLYNYQQYVHETLEFLSEPEPMLWQGVIRVELDGPVTTPELVLNTFVESLANAINFSISSKKGKKLPRRGASSPKKSSLRACVCAQEARGRAGTTSAPACVRRESASGKRKAGLQCW